MSFMENNTRTANQEEDCLYAIQLVSGSVMPMVMQSAIDLNLFETIAKQGEGAQVSPSKIASLIVAKNPEAPMMLDRILRLLASYSVLTSSIKTHENGDVERLYGLAPMCKYLVSNEDGVCFSPWMHLFQDPILMQSWAGLKDSVLEGGNAFEKVHGAHMFEFFGKDSKLNELFNRAMLNHTTIFMKKIITTYKGFEEVKNMVDVGGGLGSVSRIITSKYPTIKCINFDLPHVIKHAPSYPGVEHVGGDMFVSIPKGETVFMKGILHDWDDDNCVKILKNCYEAITDHGKLIVVEAILPEEPQSTTVARSICQLDLLMMVYCPTGKERTEKEFELLAKEAGFSGVKLICCTYNYWVMEFYKQM